MKDFVFITDLHIQQKSSVRTGSLLEDICNKLKFVTDYCNEHHAPLLIGGDIFNNPVISEEAKNKVIPILANVQNHVYSIIGNHDEIFSSREYMDRTSFGNLMLFNWFHVLDLQDFDFGDVILTSQTPIVSKGKPQIVIKHGFFHTFEDKEWTFHDEDLQTDDSTLILLGHDHTPYPPVSLRNSTVLRIGSFLRQTRDSNSYRTPQLLHITVDSGLHYELVDIPSRPSEEIFNIKFSELSSNYKHDTYESIISMIQQSGSQELSLQDALFQVTDEQTAKYLLNLVERGKAESITKRGKI